MNINLQVSHGCDLLVEMNNLFAETEKKYKLLLIQHSALINPPAFMAFRGSSTRLCVNYANMRIA